MNDLHAEGKFTGKVVETKFEQDSNEKDGLVLVFYVKLEDGHIAKARHRTHGQYSHITRKMIEALGLDWPKGVLDIHTLEGRDVPVKIKHKQGKTMTYENAYIDFGTGGNEPATPDFARSVVEKMAAEPDAAVADDDIPF